MDPMPSGSSEPQPGPSRGCGRGQNRGFSRRGWRRGAAPYWKRGGAPREKPTTLPIPGISRDNSPGLSDVPSTSVAPPPDVRPLESIELDETSEEYPGWKLYFPKEKPDPNSSTVQKVRAIKKHFKRNEELYNLIRIKQQFWFNINLQKLVDDHQFTRDWGTFQQDLTEKPEHTLSCAGVAMHKLISSLPEISPSPQSSQNYQPSKTLQSIRPRIQGYTPVVNLHSLKVNNYDRMVAVRGTVIRASATEIVCTWMAFRCSKCGSEQAVRQPDGNFTNPTSCKSGCRARSNFTPLLSSPYTRTEAFQSIRLQESMMGGDLHDTGRVPRCVEIELTADLVDAICPGDDVTVTGILKVRPQEEIQRKGQPNIYKMYMRAVAVSSNKNSLAGKKSDFSEKDMQAIKMISEEPSVFKLFVQSLCPAIYGHEMVKAGLILGLFGGSGGTTPGERRCEIHVLMVGDPGIGKSQMLQACANISPRGIFVCGNSSSSAGLTVSVRHEKGCVGGGGSLEAGALVLADQGACCIDEFDKMSSNHQSLLEVMEQQMVSVAKAGVLCSLPARTSVLAAANPSGGHYNHTKTILENLKLQPALLSRFDLVFILLDRPNRYLDKLMTAHIQALHAGTKKIPSNMGSYPGSKDKENFAINNNSQMSEDKTFEERLKMEPGEEMDLLPSVLMQKFIAYAKKNIHPRLTEEAAQEIKKYYLELRLTQTNANGLPVTTRQLEALIRLTQARARIDLSSEATIQHALDVLAIMRYSLNDEFDSPEAGEYMTSSRRSGAGLSLASQVKNYLKILKRRSGTLEKTLFTTDELKEIAAHGGLAEGFSNIVDALNAQGYLLKKGQNMYKVLLD